LEISDSSSLWVTRLALSTVISVFRTIDVIYYILKNIAHLTKKDKRVTCLKLSGVINKHEFFEQKK